VQAAPRRTLRLTSPNTRGKDVEALQRGLNARLRARGRKTIKVDGQYGKQTEAAKRKVLYLLGAPRKRLNDGATPFLQRILRNPKLRPPHWYPIASDRKKYLAEQHRELDELMRALRSRVGTRETGAFNSNRGPEIDKWQRDVGMIAQPWCAAFLIYFIRRICGIPLPDDWRYTPNILRDAKIGKYGAQFHGPSTKPQQGWLALWKWPGISHDPVDHVSIVDDPTTPEGPETIEGNTTPDGETGSQNNGGSVARKHRHGYGLVGYVELPIGR
jgi:hypothetical protein